MPPTPRDPSTPSTSSRPGVAATDARPALITSRRTDPSMNGAGAGGAMAIRDVLQTRPRNRHRRMRLSSGVLIGIALAGSIGAVTAVNATLFPSLGRPTSESVWQNPGKIPAAAAPSTPSTTPRASRVLLVDPTAPPVVSAESARALTTTLPASSDAPTSSVEVLAVPQPTTAKPTNSGSGSTSGGGTVTGTTIATVPAAAPVTTAGTKSGSSSSTSGPASTDHSSTSSPATTPTTDPVTTDGTAPTDTQDTVPGDTVDDGSSGGNSGKGKGG